MVRASSFNSFSAELVRFCGAGALSLPPWIVDLTGLVDAEPVLVSRSPAHVQTVETPSYSIVRACIPRAAVLDAQSLEAMTVGAYETIFQQLSAMPARNPVRFWNFLPGIHEDMGDGRDRYMVFNAGRFRAFEKRYGSREAFDASVATASGVGHDGDELLIFCLACDAPGEPLDNPRQIKPYRYSQRFGPLPPCFARATIVNPRGASPLLLVGGTASIRGEDSVHLGDLTRQVEETFENLAALVRAAGARCGAGSWEDSSSALQCYRELRVYHPKARHATPLESLIRAAMPRLQRLELLRMDLCRSELLVEIEGLADLG